MLKFIAGALYKDEKPSLSRIMLFIWFFILIILAIKFIVVYGSSVVNGTEFYAPSPDWIVSIFAILMVYVFGSKTGLIKILSRRKAVNNKKTDIK